MTQVRDTVDVRSSLPEADDRLVSFYTLTTE